MNAKGPDPDAAGGVYVIVDVSGPRIRYVGRSKDVDRRIASMVTAGSPYADRSRYSGVVVARTDEYAALRGIEQKAMDKYFG